MALSDIKVKISAVAEGFDKTIGQVESKLEGLSKKTDGISESTAEWGQKFTETGRKVTAAGAVMTGAIAGLVAAGASWSAEVAGQQFLYNNLDSSIQKVISSESKHANSIGLTEQQYKNSATSIATYYNNMGFASEETARLSSESMNLVADLAAITDMPFDEAMDRFKSGLMGEMVAPCYRNVA